MTTLDRINALYDDWHTEPFDTCPPCQGALDHDDRDERVFMGRTWRHTVQLRHGQQTHLQAFAEAVLRPRPPGADGVVTYEVHP